MLLAPGCRGLSFWSHSRKIPNFSLTPNPTLSSVDASLRLTQQAPKNDIIAPVTRVMKAHALFPSRLSLTTLTTGPMVAAFAAWASIAKMLPNPARAVARFLVSPGPFPPLAGWAILTAGAVAPHRCSSGP